MSVKPIVFEPIFNIGDTVYVMYNNKIHRGIISTRKFIDLGEEEMDEDDYEKARGDGDTIVAAALHNIQIKYRVEIGEKGANEWFTEEQTWPDIETLANDLKEHIVDLEKPFYH